MDKEKYLEAGRIVNTHGIKGEVRIEPWADSAASLLCLRKMYVGGREMVVERSREHRGFLVVKLKGVDDMESAASLKGETVCADRGDLALPEGRFFLSDVIGARVVSDAGEELGVLDDVIELPGQHVCSVKGSREILIPAVPEFIVGVDAENGTVTVHLIEGM